MANLIIPSQTRTRQPSPVIALSRSGLANGVVLAALPSGGSFFDRVTEKRSTVGGTQSGTIFGSAVNFDGTASCNFSYHDNYDFAATDHTVIAIVEVTGRIGGYGSYVFGGWDGGDGVGPASLRLNSDLTVSYVTGIVSNTLTTTEQTRPGAFFCGVRAQGLPGSIAASVILNDGVSASTTFTSALGPARGFVIGSQGTSSYDLAIVAKVTLCVAWRRALSDYEIAEFCKNPWQIFAPERRVLYFPLGGGGTGSWTLAISDAAHAQIVGSSDLSVTETLAVGASMHAHASQVIDLVQSSALVIASVSQAQSSDSPVLVAGGSLGIGHSQHSHTIQSIDLTQAHQLDAMSAIHSHGSSTIDLTQANQLSVESSRHTHAATSIDLTQSYLLIAAASQHAHAIQSADLTVGLALSVTSSQHTHTVVTIDLTQAHLLGILSAAHLHAAASADLTQGYALSINGSAHQHVSASLDLTQSFFISIASAIHNQYASQIDLQTHVLLLVSNTLHAHYVSSSSDVLLPVGDSVFIVVADDRLYAVVREDTIFGA